MDPNIAAWLIGGGPTIETRAERRERDQRRALLTSRAIERSARPAPLARLRDAIRPAPAGIDPACCPA